MMFERPWRRFLFCVPIRLNIMSEPTRKSDELAPEPAPSIKLPLYLNSPATTVSPTHPVQKPLLKRFVRRFFHRKRHRSVILIHIAHVQQIFNSFDPSPFHERDIDADAEQFIVTMAESETHNRTVDVFQINVHLNQLPTEQEYRTFFKKRAEPSLFTLTTPGSTDDLNPAPSPAKPTPLPSPTIKEEPVLPSSVPGSYSPEGSPGMSSKNIRDPAITGQHPASPVRINEQDMVRLLSEDLQITLQNHFAFQSELVKNEIQRVLTTARTAAILGFALMLVALTLANLVESIDYKTDNINWASIFGNALQIFAWVVWWRPIEMMFFGWWTLAFKKRLLDKLSRCDLKVFHDKLQVVVNAPAVNVTGGGRPKRA